LPRLVRRCGSFTERRPRTALHDVSGKLGGQIRSGGLAGEHGVYGTVILKAQLDGVECAVMVVPGISAMRVKAGKLARHAARQLERMQALLAGRGE